MFFGASLLFDKEIADALENEVYMDLAGMAREMVSSFRANRDSGSSLVFTPEMWAELAEEQARKNVPHSLN